MHDMDVEVVVRWLVCGMVSLAQTPLAGNTETVALGSQTIARLTMHVKLQLIGVNLRINLDRSMQHLVSHMLEPWDVLPAQVTQ